MPDEFFAAVQRYDYALFQAKRGGKSAGADAEEALVQTTHAIDRY